LTENSLHSLSHDVQSSIASSNSRITYIHTFMYAVPFLITCFCTASRKSASAMPAVFAPVEKSVFDAGPVNSVVCLSKAFVTQWSA